MKKVPLGSSGLCVPAVITSCDIQLTREEWYRLYLSAGHILP